MLDCKLNWKAHLENRIQKACRTLGQCRRAVGRVWGLSPKVMQWLYCSVVRPILSYGSVSWWHKAQTPTMIGKLNHLQRLGLLCMTGAMFTTPTAALECLCNLRPLHLYVEAEARAELFRLKNWGHFKPRSFGVDNFDKLWQKIMESNPLCNAPNDCMISKILTGRKFSVVLPTRDDWLTNDLQQAADHLFFTDGSLCEELAGSGVFSDNPKTQLALHLGQNVSVFQAEVLAVSETAKFCEQYGLFNKRIFICSDSKASLLALSSFRFSSRLVLECWTSLQRLAENNSVTLVWVPGHSGIEGNEMADSLAREGSSKRPITSEPVIPLSKSWFSANLQKWCLIAHSTYWNEINSCRQTKLLIKKPLSASECNSLLALKRPALRGLIGAITGHFYFNKHLNRMGLSQSPFCERCKEYEETAFHLICLCPRLAQRRNKVLGNFYISPNKYKDLSLRQIKDFLSGISLRTHL
jgi:ribonuclease HI